MKQTPVKLWRGQKEFAKMLGKTGKIVTFTVVRIPPNGFSEQAPYPVVIVKFDDGKMTIGQLVDSEKKHLKSGQKVEAILRKMSVTDKEGVIPYAIKFRPL
ncbi:MAG TPA: OB-fold domain-containing protein [Candidatus Saccharimonadales bacterium]|nr:OB-fold domain-containing protein [Candidatus Saccharimonadales bacterium]